MKVLIQNCKTHKYFAAEKGWVREKENAAIFPSSAEAMNLIVRDQMRDVQIKFVFSNPQFDMVVSKSESCP
jgi:hypothetical protein